MDVRIEDSWKQRLQPEFNKPYFEKLVAFVKQEYARYTVYPPGHLLFYAFDTCPFDKVKVVIIGQDPYHEPGQWVVFLCVGWGAFSSVFSKYF